MADGKAFTSDHEADNLFAVRATVSRMTALGLGIGCRQALKIGGGQVVKIYGWVEIEEDTLALDECRLDGAAMRVQRVENTRERILR